jgi:hypothetical protein
LPLLLANPLVWLVVLPDSQKQFNGTSDRQTDSFRLAVFCCQGKIQKTNQLSIVNGQLLIANDFRFHNFCI